MVNAAPSHCLETSARKPGAVSFEVSSVGRDVRLDSKRSSPYAPIPEAVRKSTPLSLSEEEEEEEEERYPSMYPHKALKIGLTLKSQDFS